MFNCRAWQSERADTLRRCEEDGGFRVSMVRQLQGSKKGAAVVLGFLMKIRVGLQPREQEQRKEEQRRCRDETCGLEENRLEGDEGEKRRK